MEQISQPNSVFRCSRLALASLFLGAIRGNSETCSFDELGRTKLIDFENGRNTGLAKILAHLKLMIVNMLISATPTRNNNGTDPPLEQLKDCPNPGVCNYQVSTSGKALEIS
jgi:hypothetical protein